MPRPSTASLRCIAGLAGVTLALCASCRNPTYARDATVHLLTPGTTELGVATDYGIVFLGQGQQTGSVQFDAWFGGDPSREAGVVEAVGGGLFTTAAEIRIPVVPVTFEVPPEGSEVLLLSRTPEGRRRNKAVVRKHPSVSGLLLQMIPGSPPFHPMQVGTGVYVEKRGRPCFLGLVSGTVVLSDAQGTPREYLAVVGPTETWRVVTHQRNHLRNERWVYREDVL